MSHRLSRSLLVVAFLGLSWAGARTVSQAQASPALVRTMPARILTDARGRTLYLFAQDKHNKSVCTGQCAAFWPPLLLQKGTSVPSTLPGIAGTFGVATRADGARQLAYDGSPLYTFKEDRKAGQMHGQGVLGLWWVVVVNSVPPSGNAVAAPSPTAAPASSATPTSSAPAPATPTSSAPAPVTPTPSGGYGY